MWWILFTAVDLYIGLIILDVMGRSGSIPQEKLPRLAAAKKVTIFLLVIAVAAFVVALVRRLA